MTMKTIDVQGKLCPVPLIMTKKALATLEENEVMKVILDNETSMHNVIHFLKEYQMQVKKEEKNGIFTLFVSKTGEIPADAEVDKYCSIPEKDIADYVFMVKRNRMGDGADELGEILIKACINTLPELESKPKKIIFLNSGIFLSLQDSPVLDALKKMEESGIEILVCGTCLDYYNKKEVLGVGRVSNMYDILDSMATATKVVFA
jgi:selenium metabolism protein YedF